jgi:hypothetical protein
VTAEEQKNESITKLKNSFKKKLDSKSNSNRIKEENNKMEEKKDEVLEHINSNREISEKEIKSSPIIIIKEDDGKLLNGKEITINASGMIGGRNLKDGVTIFGKSKNNKENFKLDFELNYEENLNYPYIFAIYYQRENKNYFLRAFSGKESDNRLLYVKLNNCYSLKLKQKEIFSAGNVVFQVIPLENNKIEIINLSKKNSEDEQKKIFDPKEIKEISIGRDKNCTFSFPKDKSFSRCQTSFLFDEKTNEWTIIDGSKTKSSTNGTWIFGTHSFEIKDQLIVEILNSKFSFSVRTQSNQ